MALSLAGVTGIVVSVGVTVDSYVVYFERLKDEVQAGRTLRSSTERAFTRAFRTILAADISSFIGAALLYHAHRRPGARLRLLPRALDDPRRGRRLVLHPAAGGPPRLEPASSPKLAGSGVARGLGAAARRSPRRPEAGR